MADRLFEHVVIVGVGLLGASLGMALRKRGMAGRVTGVGRAGSHSLEVAKERGAIDDGGTELEGVIGGETDLVVLCTPIRQFPGAMKAIGPLLKKGAMVTDVGSTKAEVMRWAGEILPGGGKAGVQFVGSHPMCGSEQSGPGAAREDLYQNAVCMLSTFWHTGIGEIRSGDGGANAEQMAAYRRVEALWRGVGMRVIDMPAEEHDRWVAAVSHLPHALAFTLVNTAAADVRMLDVAAGGFLDTSRIASGDVDMWTDILMTNQGAVIEFLEAFEGNLRGLKEALAAGDEGAIRRTLSAAKGARDAWIGRRKAAGMQVR